MGRLVVLLVLGGCSSVLGLGNPQPALPPPSCPIGSFDPCAAQTPDGAIDFATDTTLQTDRDCNLVLYDPDVGSICVLFATDISVTAKVTLFGTRPVVLAATGSITIDGTV